MNHEFERTIEPRRNWRTSYDENQRKSDSVGYIWGQFRKFSEFTLNIPDPVQFRWLFWVTPNQQYEEFTEFSLDVSCFYSKRKGC